MKKDKLKVLYYNWIQFDNPKNIGGGVNIYQKNLIDILSNSDNVDLYFLSSGWKYNPFKPFTYLKKTKNIYKDKCKSFEIINSSIMSPGFDVYMVPEKFINDTSSVEMLDKFISKYGPFDVIHFNNIEGISINVLKLKEKYPKTKFIVSIHNYLLICPLVQYYQNHKDCICNDIANGIECVNCSLYIPEKKEYVRRCRNYFYDKFPKVFKLFINVLTKIFKFKAVAYMGSPESMNPEAYVEYRKHNIKYLNRYADSVLCVSERVSEIMKQHGVNPDLVKTSYIGTKFAQSEIGYSIATTTNPFTICYMGYARIDKGFYFLLDILKRFPKEYANKMNIVLAVKGAEKKIIRKQLCNFNDVVIYDGYTHKQLPKILANVNLGIVPVLWEDNLPQVAIEMVAHGVPILCSSFGGASELCNSDLFKFSGGNKEEFIEKLKLFIDNPNLLKEYWNNHPPLMTMDNHINELMTYYQGD